jgi:hypothetical protein
MIRKAELVTFALVLLFGASAEAAFTKIKVSPAGLAKIKAADHVPTTEAVDEYKTNSKVVIDSSNPDFDSSGIKRDPAVQGKKHNVKEPESADLLSTEFKTFETEFLNVMTPDQVEGLLSRYEKMSDSDFIKLHPDIQFVVNRVAPILAFRGIFWRMAPLTHKSVMTQMMLLNLVRSFGENVMIFEPDSQWQAYMAFFGTPSPAQVAADKDFKDENQLITFLAAEVAPLLQHAITRLSSMPLTHRIGNRNAPVYFDNRIRFGKQAFKDEGKEAYDPNDRFARIGKAERYMSVARFYRRLSIIAQLASYNWGGNIALRKELGKDMAIDSQIDGAKGFDPFAVEGLTRQNRVEKAKSAAKNYGLFAKMPGASGYWMPRAYTWFANYARYSELAWKEIEANYEPGHPSYDYLLDPDLFQGRRDQIAIGIDNLRAMFPLDGEEARPVVGGISGDQIKVDMRAFFNSAPSNLVALMPTAFSHNEDITPLRAVYEHMNPPQTIVVYDDIDAKDPGLSLAIVVPKGKEKQAQARLKKLKSRSGGYLDAKKADAREMLGIGNGRDYEFRNYLWGRAIGWDHSQFSFISKADEKGRWNPLATDTDVARAQRVLAEVRGGRAVLNSLAIFIK